MRCSSQDDKGAYNLVVSLGMTYEEDGRQKGYEQLVQERREAKKLIVELQNKVTSQAIAYQNLMSKHRKLLNASSKRNTLVGYIKGLWRNTDE